MIYYPNGTTALFRLIPTLIDEPMLIHADARSWKCCLLVGDRPRADVEALLVDRFIHYPLKLLGGGPGVPFVSRGLKRELRAGNGRAELWLGAFAALVAFSLAGLFEDNWRDTEVQRVALFVIAIPYCLRAGELERAEKRDGADSAAA